MAIFNYTLPSGATFQLDAPAGTTQVQADYIFYNQVAAGTFVGYNPGDTLTHPTEALLNFGLSRLERGTAGVNNQPVLAYNDGVAVSTSTGASGNIVGLFSNSTLGLLLGSAITGNLSNVTISNTSTASSQLTEETLVAIASELPSVIALPGLDNVAIQNTISQADYIQVTSNPAEGRISQGPTSIGDLTAPEVQALLAQSASVVNQSYSALTQQKGVGKYGFNAQQLERAGYIKPGYAQQYCPLNASAQTNPPNFVSFMNSPTPWTGLNGVTSVNDILTNEALQNRIQQNLMQQSYSSFVSTGLITPGKSAVTIPSASTGFIYSNAGTLTTTSIPALLAINPTTASTSGAVATGSIVGQVPPTVSNLGTTASAAYSSGLSSLSSGAVSFSPSALSSLAASTGVQPSQLPGLATGLLGGAAASATAKISSAVNADIGALLNNGSKFGPALTTAWAQGSAQIGGAISKLPGSLSNITSNLPSLNTLTGSLATNATNIAGSLATNATNIAQGALTNVTGALNGAVNGAIKNINGQAQAALNTLGKASQFGINFSNFSLSGLVSKIQPAAAFSNTVNRQTIDAAMTRVIGSSKIASPTFSLPSASSLGISADIAQAKALLSQAQSTATAITSQVQGAAGQATAIANGALTQVQTGIQGAVNTATSQAQGAVNTAITTAQKQAIAEAKTLFK